jgi:hypothetical protein
LVATFDPTGQSVPRWLIEIINSAPSGWPAVGEVVLNQRSHAAL